jgi:hypothetical protein
VELALPQRVDAFRKQHDDHFGEDDKLVYAINDRGPSGSYAYPDNVLSRGFVDTGGVRTTVNDCGAVITGSAGSTKVGRSQEPMWTA